MIAVSPKKAPTTAEGPKGTSAIGVLFDSIREAVEVGDLC